MLRNVPSTTVFRRRLKTDLTVASPLLGSTNVGMQDIQEGLKPHKNQRKLNFDVHAGKELRDLFSVETSEMRHKTNGLRHSNAKSKILCA